MIEHSELQMICVVESFAVQLLYPVAQNVEVLDFLLNFAGSLPMGLATFPMVHSTEVCHALIVLLSLIIAELVRKSLVLAVMMGIGGVVVVVVHPFGEKQKIMDALTMIGNGVALYSSVILKAVALLVFLVLVFGAYFG